jgi:hypothetical protein
VNLTRRWREQIEDFGVETEMKVEQLRKKHEVERNAFELHWQYGDTLRKYRKASSRLLGMWRMEKFLARTEDYDNAQVMQYETSELTRRELEMQQAMANRDFHDAKQKLRQRQKDEMEMLVSTRQHWKDCLLGKQKVEKAHWVNKRSATETRCAIGRGGHEPLLPSKTRDASPKREWQNRTAASFEYQTVLPPVTPPSEWEKPCPALSSHRPEEQTERIE